MIERAFFYQLPSRWNKRYVHSPEFCHGRTGGGAEFLYYDPWRRRVIREAEADRLARAARPRIPDDHPLRLSFFAVPDGFDPDELAVDDHDGLDDDIPFDN